MVEVHMNVENGNEVIANKELKMMGKVIVQMGETFTVTNVLRDSVQLKNKKLTVSLDKDTFAEHFEKVKRFDNILKNDKYDKKLDQVKMNEYKDEPEVIYATAAALPDKVDEDLIYQMLEEAEYEISTVFDKCTVVSCQLPNGFIITESSACVDPENYNEEIGVEICMQKIEEKLWELEGYHLQSQKYEAEVLDDCLNCERINDCEERPFDIVYSRKNVELN